MKNLLQTVTPRCQKLWLEVMSMQTGTAEIVDFDEARAKSSGDNGGFDHFTTMKIGTVFCCAANGYSGSVLDEYMLCSKTGLTVLLKNADDADNGKFERHIGYKFWRSRTLIQILIIPQEKEEENGNSA